MSLQIPLLSTRQKTNALNDDKARHLTSIDQKKKEKNGNDDDDDNHDIETGVPLPPQLLAVSESRPDDDKNQLRKEDIVIGLVIITIFIVQSLRMSVLILDLASKNGERGLSLSILVL